jgi:1-acyl-sn-glycerol-3-phosphate acyltransferase
MTCHLALAKVLILFISVFAGGFVQTCVTIGHKEFTPMLGVRYFLMRVVNGILARIFLYCSASCLWVNQEKPSICYKKYLGPDWKPDYDLSTTSTIICNHSAFMNAIMMAYHVMPSHITKGEVKDVLGAGRLCINAQCFFLDRSSSSNK